MKIATIVAYGFALYQDPALDIKVSQLARRGGARYSDAACSLIDSIYNNKRDIQTVNVLNRGTNLDLPHDVVIERNCIIDKNGAHPIAMGHTPLKIRGLLQPAPLSRHWPSPSDELC